MKNVDRVLKPTHRAHIPLHDYRERCIYHITLVVSDRLPLLGSIAGSSNADARVALTPLGRFVRKAIQDIPLFEKRKGNDVQILAAVTMPEHVHFVLFVRQPMKEKLGMVLRGFKQGCNKALRQWLAKAGLHEEGAVGAGRDAGKGAGKGAGLEKPALPNGDVGSKGSGEVGSKGSGEVGSERSGEVGLETGGTNAVMSLLGERSNVCSDISTMSNVCSDITTTPIQVAASSLTPDEAAFVRWLRGLRSERILQGHALFEADFDETRLRRKGQLNAMIRYVHNNPEHRWLKQHKPQWLKPQRGIMIAGRCYDAIGNVNLLGLARWQVFVRSRWTDKERRDYKNECVIKARQGYALVSPFISPHEAEVRDFCLKEGHSVIVLTDNGFSDFAQCPGGLYDYCVQGQVLVLAESSLPHIERKGSISRQECMQLNAMATEIVSEG